LTRVTPYQFCHHCEPRMDPTYPPQPPDGSWSETVRQEEPNKSVATTSRRAID
jgi:hypothetical protein